MGLTGQRQSSRTRKSLLASLREDSEEEGREKRTGPQKKKPQTPGTDQRAISKSGYTCRGRVKQKAQKRVELVQIGERRLAKGWYNAGYIFPLGFKSHTQFKSSLDLSDWCVHECEIVKGAFWPFPTFVITAQDRPDEQLVAKSCTGCWNLVLKRINGEIIRRRTEGEELPPPPKTAIAGPEYFGLIQTDIVRKIEALDPDKKCDQYWAGKLERQIATRNLTEVMEQRAEGKVHQCRTRGRRPTREGDSEEEEEAGGEDGGEDVNYTLSKWSTLCRLDRYQQRCLKRGSLPEATADDGNPLPNFVDAITMQPVITPAISPHGHVLGIATWRAWLSENRVCPFTRKPLNIEQCTVLTKNNIDRYRERIADT